MSSLSHFPHTAWVEIDRQSLRANIRLLKKLALAQLKPRFNRDINILSVVKADAYGHGMVDCVRSLAQERGKFFAVSNVIEAAELRRAGCRAPVLVLEATLLSVVKDIVKHDLTPCVCTLEFAAALDRAARKSGKIVPVHVKIDTGMSRMGVASSGVVAFVLALTQFKNLSVQGMLTHFPVADSDSEFTHGQISAFTYIVAELIREGIPLKYLHAANSLGTAAYVNPLFNLVRPGVMLYGLYPDDKLCGQLALKPVMSVKARVLLTKILPKGAGVSYGHTLRVRRETQVAVVGIGYSDGYPRALSNRGQVLINGKRCAILGRVTMDQIIVDISKAGRVKIGDEVVVIGRQKSARITAEEVALWAGTINYEIVCHLGNRLTRRLV